MSLALKRLAQKIQQEDFPAFQADIRTITGYEPVVEVLWDSFTEHTNEYPLNRLVSPVMRDIKTALAGICKDEFGRSALQAGLDRIRIDCTDNKDEFAFRFDNKELYLKAQLVNSVMHAPTAAVIREVIEGRL